jgi:hypothetical protein
MTIRYTMQSDHQSFARRVKAEFEVTASEADLRFRAPISRSVDVVLEVPVQTNVYVRDKGGESFRQRNRRRRGRTNDRRRSKGWLGKRIHFRGDGNYRRYAHTFAGDIRFFPLSASR